MTRQRGKAEKKKKKKKPDTSDVEQYQLFDIAPYAGLKAHPSDRFEMNRIHFQLAMVAYYLNAWLFPRSG